MAIVGLTDFKTEYASIYKLMTKSMTDEKSVMGVMLGRLKDEYDSFEIDPERKAELITTAYLTIIEKLNKDVNASVEGVFRIQQISRQTQGYDDNMLVKVAEQQGGVTSFAVNSDSSSAQSAIDSLKLIMGRLQHRTTKLNTNEPDGIIYGNIATTPTVTITSVTADGFVIDWTNESMTDYVVYIDGLQQTVTTGTTFTTTGLDIGKYAVNVSGRLGGVESAQSGTIIAEVV